MVKPNQLWERREPKGDVWDRVVVKAPSPLDPEAEFVISAENVFAAAETEGPQVVAVSALASSLEENYVYVEDVSPVPVVIGENALGGFVDGLV